MCRRRGVGPAKVSGKISRQFVRGMVDTVQIKTVLVITEVQTFVIVKLMLQILFHSGVSRLHLFHILFF